MNNIPTDMESLRVFLAENPVHQPVVPKGPGLGLGNRMGKIESTSAMLAMEELGITASAVQASVFRELRPKYIDPEGFLVEYKGIGMVPIGHTGMTIEEQFVESIVDRVRHDITVPFAADADHIPLKGDSPQDIDEFHRLVAEAQDRTVFTIDPHFCLDHAAAAPADRFCRVLPAYDRAVAQIARVKGGSPYVIELSIDESPGVTTPAELEYLVGKVVDRSIPLFSIAPAIGFDKKDQDSSELARGLQKLLPQLNQIARDNGLLLGIHSGDGKGRETRKTIGDATDGNVWYRIAPERQRMFFKLLSDSSRGSDERTLFEELFHRLEELVREGLGSKDKVFAANCRLGLKDLEQAQATKVTVDCRIFYDFGFLLVREFKTRFNSLGQEFVQRHRESDLRLIKDSAQDLGLV